MNEIIKQDSSTILPENEKPVWVKPEATAEKVQDATQTGAGAFSADGVTCHS